MSTTTITQPAAGTTISGQETVTATFDAPASFVLATVTIDGKQVGSADNAEPISFSLDTTKIADGSHTLGVSVKYRHGKRFRWAKASVAVKVANAAPAPPPPPPAPTGTILFDGRAKLLTALSSTGAPPREPDGTLLQVQTPTIWTGLIFNNNSITLVPDARYGKAYKCSIGPGNHSPWDTEAGFVSPYWRAAGELTKRRANDLGKWDWFAIAVRVDKWASPSASWIDLLSLGYETLSQSQVALNLQPTGSGLEFVLKQNSGHVDSDAPGAPNGTVNYQANLVPLVYGQWREFVLGVKWATDNTGGVQVYSRIPGGSWAKLFEKLNEPTYLWGHTHYRDVAQDMHDESEVLDKMGLYYGFSNHSIGTFPAETVYETGLVRCSDLATAQATFPA